MTRNKFEGIDGRRLALTDTRRGHGDGRAPVPVWRHHGAGRRVTRLHSLYVGRVHPSFCGCPLQRNPTRLPTPPSWRERRGSPVNAKALMEGQVPISNMPRVIPGTSRSGARFSCFPGAAIALSPGLDSPELGHLKLCVMNTSGTLAVERVCSRRGRHPSPLCPLCQHGPAHNDDRNS